MLLFRTWPLLVICLFVHLSSPLVAKSNKHEVAICAIFQNEAAYLREWIEFHTLVGVTKFYLYNNLSTDNYSEVLDPYIQSGKVELIEWGQAPDQNRTWNMIQCAAYNDAIKRSKKKTKWLAFIDTDEFLFPVTTDTLTEFLLSYEDIAAIRVNWQMYGTSGVAAILPGHLMIEDLIYKAPKSFEENAHVKSIVQPKYVQVWHNPHSCILKSGFFQAGADREVTRGPKSPIKIDKIRINHYWTRDEDFFTRVKIARRKQWQDAEIMERKESVNKEIDTAIYKYVPRLKKAMGFI